MGWFVLAILIAYGCAMAAPLICYRVRGRLAAFVFLCIVLIVAICPILIPSSKIGLRAASAFVSGDIIFKMVEFNRVWGNVKYSAVLGDYYRFLIPFPVLAAVFPDHKRRLLRPEPVWPQLIRLFGGIAGIAIAVLSLKALNELEMVRSSFAISHTVMLLAFILAIESLSRAICGLERLAGFDTTPLIRNAYLSRSVLEFWRRYNYRIHDWHHRHIFLPTGGRRSPVRSLLLVFLFSGIFHEVAFALATSRLTGYQFAFFAIQGPAALASGRYERMAKRGGVAAKITAHCATIIFIAVTSVLFFHGVSKIFPFVYASGSPLP